MTAEESKKEGEPQKARPVIIPITSTETVPLIISTHPRPEGSPPIDISSPEYLEHMNKCSVRAYNVAKTVPKEWRFNGDTAQALREARAYSDCMDSFIPPALPSKPAPKELQ